MLKTTTMPRTSPTRDRIDRFRQCCEDLQTLMVFAKPALDTLLDEIHDDSAALFAYDAAKRFCANWEALNMAKREAEREGARA